MANLATKGIRLHVVITTVAQHSKDKQVDASQEDAEKNQLADFVIAGFIRQLVAKVSQSEQANVLFSSGKKQTEKDQHQAANKGWPEDHVDKTGKIWIRDVENQIVKHCSHQKRENNGYCHCPQQGNPAVRNAPEKSLWNITECCCHRYLFSFGQMLIKQQITKLILPRSG